jgi:RIO kinase 1
LITEVLYLVKSGKEATVYCCKAGPKLGTELVAAKVYRPAQNRNFKNDTIYQEGRVILKERVRRAVGKKTRFGREAHFALWIGYEFEHLKMLHKAGAATPQPYRLAESAILMEFLGDHQQAASILNRISLEPEEVQPLFGFMMREVELWLKCNLIHADLSPFNILYWEGQLKVIDFPQAVDPRFNPNAYSLLERDIDKLCHYWTRYGLEADATQLAKELWTRFQNSQL